MHKIFPGFCVCKHTDYLQEGDWFLCEDARYLTKALALRPAGIIGTPAVLAGLDYPNIHTECPYKTWSDLSVLAYPKRPKFVCGVTGTNGKTSTAQTAFRIFRELGLECAYIGTNGVLATVETQFNTDSGVRTTPDALELHQILHCFAENGITHLVLEVSSSGLERKRVANLPLDLAVWTSFSQEHLEIHKTMLNYWNAKIQIIKLLKKNGKLLIGRELEEQIASTNVQYEVYNREYYYEHSDYRFFMRDNLQASGRICELAGFSKTEVQEAINRFKGGIEGRLEFVAKNVVVDFAHNPTSLERLLLAFKEKRVVLVFGCGGERDPEKRPLMGKIADKYSEITIVTDDNPRSEDPGIIRSQILAECKGIEIPDRRTAIQQGILLANQIGGICIIAGKGREQMQIYHQSVPFSDLEEAKNFLEELKKNPRSVNIRSTD